MGLFTRYNPRDRIYISGLQYENEQLAEGQTGALFCDSKGNLTTSTIDISLLEIAQNYVTQLHYEGGKGAAVVCIEIAPGQSVTFAVEINAEQAEALTQINRYAFEIGDPVIPDRLKKYAAQIIKLADNKRKELKKDYEQRSRLLVQATPQLLEHLATSPDAPIHLELPSTKTDIIDPSIFLRRLPANEQTRPDMQRVLALDNEGTLWIVRIATKVLDDAEKELEEWRKANNACGVIIIVFSRDRAKVTLHLMEIHESQKKALDIVRKHWEETGSSMIEIPLDVQAILVKAKTFMLSGNPENTNSCDSSVE